MSLVITGSIAYDYIMSFPGKFTDHILPDSLERLSLSFHVHEMTRHWGGTGANISYTLAWLGERPLLVGTAGKDCSDYRRWLDEVGVDTSALRDYDDIFTASFFVTTDESNNQIASFYAGAMDRAHEVKLQDVTNGSTKLVVISPNGLQAMSDYVSACKRLKLPYMYDPSQQVVRIEDNKLRAGVEGAKLLVTNDYEYELLQNKIGLSHEQISGVVEIVIVTRGEDGSDIFAGGKQIHIPSVALKRIADPTGAGDAYRGGFLRGYAAGWPLELCGRVGALVATYVLEDRGPQSHNFTLEEFVTRFRKEFADFDDKGALDGLSTQR